MSLTTRYNFGEPYGISTFRDLIDRGVFVVKYKSIENAIPFNRIKFNRMDGREQQEYYKKLNKKKTVYNLGEANKHSRTVSKEVYDYAQLPELEDKNYYTEYKSKGGIIGWLNEPI